MLEHKKSLTGKDEVIEKTKALEPSLMATVSKLVKSNLPSRDYTELEATHIYDDGIQGACPLCSYVDKFTICPECYFVRGRFIPTNMVLNKPAT